MHRVWGKSRQVEVQEKGGRTQMVGKEAEKKKIKISFN